MDHIQVNMIQLKTFKLELDFAEYIYSTQMCRLRIFAGLPRVYTMHLPNVTYAAVGFVYINLEP